ncbi:uncharacterized protein [Dipodomys merriami]|uniref:uncharacterized protein n=1 Tax=Dipodomys merriami TaxID=94247 RepID=UPI003855F049
MRSPQPALDSLPQAAGYRSVSPPPSGSLLGLTPSRIRYFGRFFSGLAGNPRVGRGGAGEIGAAAAQFALGRGEALSLSPGGYLQTLVDRNKAEAVLSWKPAAEVEEKQIHSKIYFIQMELEKMQMELSHKEVQMELEKAASRNAKNCEGLQPFDLAFGFLGPSPNLRLPWAAPHQPAQQHTASVITGDLKSCSSCAQARSASWYHKQLVFPSSWRWS